MRTSLQYQNMTKKISNFNGVSPSELFKPNSRRNHPPNLNRRNRLHRIIVLQSPPPPDVIAEKQLTIPGGAFQLPSPGDPRHCSPQKPGPTAGNFRSLHLRPTPSPTDQCFFFFFFLFFFFCFSSLSSGR